MVRPKVLLNFWVHRREVSGIQGKSLARNGVQSPVSVWFQSLSGWRVQFADEPSGPVSHWNLHILATCQQG